MVKLKGRSALVIVSPVANTQQRFLWKTVDPISFISFFSQVVVIRATVVQTECEAKNSRKERPHKLILRYTYFRDFAKFFIYFIRLWCPVNFRKKKCFEIHILQSISFVIVTKSIAAKRTNNTHTKKVEKRKEKCLNSEILDKQERQSAW